MRPGGIMGYFKIHKRVKYFLLLFMNETFVFAKRLGSKTKLHPILAQNLASSKS